ncbi:hypothetical protein PC114_g27905, partial [Phytophthora cactorum]
GDASRVLLSHVYQSA